ncbi:hypothetical protein H114_32564 [Streptomyces gancidicus BKS 13-15]|uniref:Uncharacterized protein n=1 Tax=Streptomyces gancidicus BKS 13-15 TaxID=1284664 RepID=M3B9G1_STREZ|nr:hypothetical protein [Streptomyces gancidicus]EMF20374.1 hypothetical protein H114_32564 [Streptomyces gancidicus BKS 13-15]
MSPTTPTPDETKAARELDRLTGRFTQAEELLAARREELQAAIVKHLKARSAPGVTISDHTPYDRVHVGRIGKAGGVEPLPKTAKLTYEPAKVDAACAELDELTTAYNAAEEAVEKARKALHAAIVRHYETRTLGPGKIADHTPYRRNRILQLAREAGAPPIRGS